MMLLSSHHPSNAELVHEISLSSGSSASTPGGRPTSKTSTILLHLGGGMLRGVVVQARGVIYPCAQFPIREINWQTIDMRPSLVHQTISSTVFFSSNLLGGHTSDFLHLHTVMYCVWLNAG